MQEVSRLGRRTCRFVLWVMCASGGSLLAQATPDASVTAALRSLNARAGAAFVGEVLTVRRAGGVVEIEFAVSLPVKGELAAHYVLREWSGLWAGGQRRYWAGERALVFLHEPGLQGLSSPVDGMEGVLPVSVGAESSALEVDVQRLCARVGRNTGDTMSDAAVRLAVDTLPTLLGARVPKRPTLPVPHRPLAGREQLDMRLETADIIEGSVHDIQ